MIENYFKIAWRNLIKNKTISFINIAGLSIGMAACLLILQYVSFELSFDHFNKNASDIYRVINDRYQNGKLIQHSTSTYSGVGKAMQDDFPEVINHTRLFPFTKIILTYKDKKIGNLHMMTVDNSFLSMFNYPLVAGNTQTALQEPNSIILTETMAKRMFNLTNNDFSSLLGKVVNVGISPSYIRGICKDVQENSHLQFDLLLSYISLYSGQYPIQHADYDFTDPGYWSYLQLKHGTDYKALEAKFSQFSQRHFHGNTISGSEEKFYLQPLLKAHLQSDFEYEIGKTGNAKVVLGLLVIALLIIIIAWVNYINISTAKSMERAKEIGIRKISGATKSQLVKQFLIESLIMNIFALIIALLVVILVQKNFDSLIQHQLSLSFLFQRNLRGYTALLALFLIVGIFVSGFYPAFVLSSIRPILVLKGKYTTSAKGIIFRKALVIGQFTITVVLIICSYIVYNQMKYINEKDLGFNMTQVLIVSGPQFISFDSTFAIKQNAFIAEVKQIPKVSDAAFSWWCPGDELGASYNVRRCESTAETHFTMRNNAMSSDFINLYQMKLLAGRNFDALDYNRKLDKVHNIILNESAIKLLGFNSAKDAIGNQICIDNRNWDVTGILADFHQQSLHHEIEPTIFYPSNSSWSPFSIKLNSQNIHSTITEIKKKYDSFFPGNLFDYHFLDEKFNKQYGNDQLLEKVFSIFTGIAIFISCLGLFSLSIFSTNQRIKEIGIRKILGASIFGIIVLLSKDFIKLVLLAFVIASPIAWFIMHKWIQDFSYRINIEWWMFIAAGLIAIIIALATISLQAIKTALANPLKSLRIE